MDEKKLIFILACLLVLGFLSLFIVIIPWASWGRIPDWKAVAIDNLLFESCSICIIGLIIWLLGS